jgi:serine/threonine protein kinase
LSIPHAGEVLAGKYRVERVLGQGAMGVVVAAKHLQIGQSVAIKLLQHTATPEMAARFVREAQAAGRLRSEHVARVFDVGELVDGTPYMVMEYLDGSDLKEVLNQRGRLPIEEAIEHVLQACEAIAEAHAAGIVHRDLKPANLFLTKSADGSSTVKVLDFGISKTTDHDADSEGMQLTKSTAVLGSPLYMSPEQINSARSASAQSDIWSLGAILYQLLAGQVPFNTTSFSDLILQINMGSPPPLSDHRDDVPVGLERAIVRCLQKNLATRFTNVAELAWAIAPYGPTGAEASAKRMTRMLEAAGISVKRPPDISLTSIPPPAPNPPLEKPTGITGSTVVLAHSASATGGQHRRVGAAVIVGAAIGIVAAAVTAVFLLGIPERPPSPSTTPSAAVDVPPPQAVTAPAPEVTVPSVVASGALPPPEGTASAAPPGATATAASRPGPTRPSGTGRTAPTVRATATPTAPISNNPLEMKVKE